MYKKIIYFIALVAAFAFYVNGCSDSTITTPDTNDIPNTGNTCITPNIFCGSPGVIKVQNSCQGTVQTIDLWTGNGNGTLIGKVEFYPVSGTTWNVKYTFNNAAFSGTAIHFAIATTLSGIPHGNNGDPIPDQFAYKFNGPFAGGIKQFQITLPNNPETDGYYVAAHAAGTIGGLNINIPAGCVTFANAYHNLNLGGYYNFNISNAGAFNGNWNGWCLDLAHVMQQGTTFNCAKMYSTLNPGSIPPQDIGFPYFDHPEDFDRLNYLMNHFQVGQPVPPSSGCSTATGNITVIDIQTVVWYLMDERPQNIEEWAEGSVLCEWGGMYSMDRIKAILCDVMANGDGFVPSCANGDKVGIIVIPDGQNVPYTVQPILIPVPCGSSTSVSAWGDGKYGGKFWRSSLATFFRWKPSCN